MNKKASIIGWIIGICVVLMILLMIIMSAIEELNTSYEMPNRVICKLETGGGFGGATHEFTMCSDGKRYVNQKSYEVIRK